MSAAVSCERTMGRAERFWLKPIVAAFITLTVRLVLYALLLHHSPVTQFLTMPIDRPTSPRALSQEVPLSGTRSPLYYTHDTHEEMSAPPHLHFCVWNPSTAPATWKDVLFWRDTVGAPSTPAYLSSVMSWYTPYLPGFFARQPTSGIWLCLCDALTAFMVATWPSCTAALLYGFFILNPVSIVASIFESLVAVDVFLLCVAINTVHARGSHRRVAAVASLFACGLLGADFMALPVALLYPIGAATMKKRVAASGVAVAAVGGLTAVYIYVKRHDAHDTAFYIPPENSPMWYVRESVLPVFYRSLEAMYLQLPVAVSALILTYLPPFSLPDPSQSDKSTFQPLFPSARVAAVLFATLTALVFRTTSTLPYWCAGVLFLYASLNPLSFKEVRRYDGKVTVRSAWMRGRFLVPAYTMAIVVPLEITFYAGWALREASNPNWVFFSQIGYTAAGIMFICVWFNELVHDLLEMEWIQKRLLATSPNSTTATAAT